MRRCWSRIRTWVPEGEDDISGRCRGICFAPSTFKCREIYGLATVVGRWSLGFRMLDYATTTRTTARSRLVFLDPRRGLEPCLHCPARSLGLCGAFEAKDLERIAAMSVMM